MTMKYQFSLNVGNPVPPKSLINRDSNKVVYTFCTNLSNTVFPVNMIQGPVRVGQSKYRSQAE